jgi:paraquat-inducible protein B
MSTKPNYYKIGLFVVFAVIIILAAVVVFGAGLLTQRRIYFETYINESVSGLTVGSPVELQGVPVGKVSRIGFVGEKYEIADKSIDRVDLGRSVRVVFFMTQSRFSGQAHTVETKQLWEKRVDDGLRMQLVSNILTQQTFLEGSYLDVNELPKRPKPSLAWKPEYIFIPSVPSEITTLKEALIEITQELNGLDIESLVTTAEKLLVSVNSAVKEAKIDQLSAATLRTLDTIDRAVVDANVPQVSSQVQMLLTEIRKSSDTFNRAVTDANVPQISSKVQLFLEEARQTNDSLKSLLESRDVNEQINNVPELVARLNNVLIRIDMFLAQQTPQIEDILEDLRKVSSNIEDITDNLKVDPSLLLRSKPPPRTEVPK